jgi:peptide/nickel transport system ATP-binding protein
LQNLTHTVLDISDLEISFGKKPNGFNAVKKISFQVQRGKITAIIGESGSGKSLTALSILQLLPKQATSNGQIIFVNEKSSINILKSNVKDKLKSLRGKQISMIFQEPMTSLNPLLTCGQQVIEMLMLHENLSAQKAKEKTIELFAKVELPNPVEIINRYPHQISGGQKQRVMIAMAISCNPALLIADEPTTALDVSVQKSILELIKKLQTENNMAVVFISHDLHLISDIADEVIVMYKGEIVEKGQTKNLLQNPTHSYTKALLACIPNAQSKGKKLAVINNLNTIDQEITLPINNVSDNGILLEVKNLYVSYTKKRKYFWQSKQYQLILDDINFNVYQSEILGIVGESGCGKTTLGKTILSLIKPTSGEIIFKGKNIANLNKNDLQNLCKQVQVVFQDPYGSLNPRKTIGNAIIEPMRIHKMPEKDKTYQQQVFDLLEQVQLPKEAFYKFPHEFSGGQRQRICIARALALKPNFLIFDESVSALDVSVQAQVLNLISDLKAQLNFTAIFITHNFPVVHYISDRIMVMQKGKIVEIGSANDVMFNPQAQYTKDLLAAIPGKK